jgi:hypothetical protein
MNREFRNISDDDPADAPQASYTPDPTACPNCGRTMDGDLNEEEGRKAWHEITVRILSFVANRRNPILTLRALPFAFGCPMTGGLSQDAAARSVGMTKAAFNKEVRKVQNALLARQNRNNNPQRKSNDDHWRKQTPEAAAKSAIRRAAQGDYHR